MHSVNYKDVLTNGLPDVEAPEILIALFFPFQYWNKNIEVYDKDLRVYGDKVFGRDFEKFFHRLEKAIIKTCANNRTLKITSKYGKLLICFYFFYSNYLLQHL